ncbi:MAG: S-layer homology domain-containing protein [Oscillospiraceae bacterium]|nr:S-layer homology domain-containing protein [Oscillospiraceae bacterium]
MKKRLVSLLLALVMVFGLLPAVSASETIASGTCGENLTWRIEDDTLYLEGQGAMYDYSWGNPAPWMELEFTRVEIGSGVTSIGNFAFHACEALKTTNLGESYVRRIGEWAFSGTDISREAVPEGVTEIEDGAFRATSFLSELILPETLVHIGHSAFAFSGLKELTIPKNVKSMGDGVFEYAYTNVRFVGDAPELYPFMPEDSHGTFGLFKGSIYYPSNNLTWTEEITTVVNGWYEWIPYILNPFTDVPAGCWYEAPVLWALENGVTSGTSDTTFAPGNQCLRAHVVTFLWNAEKTPEPTAYTKTFSDVPSGAWYYKPVHWAVEKGITSGVSDTKFGAGDVCSRYQVVYFLWAAAGKPEPKTTVNPFTDVNPGHFFYKAVLWAVENGITSGTSDTTFSPAQPCNRAQVVTFLYAAYN